jgi:hypothetical protein
MGLSLGLEGLRPTDRKRSSKGSVIKARQRRMSMVRTAPGRKANAPGISGGLGRNTGSRGRRGKVPIPPAEQTSGAGFLLPGIQVSRTSEMASKILIPVTGRVVAQAEAQTERCRVHE